MHAIGMLQLCLWHKDQRLCWWGELWNRDPHQKLPRRQRSKSAVPGAEFSPWMWCAWPYFSFPSDPIFKVGIFHLDLQMHLDVTTMGLIYLLATKAGDVVGWGLPRILNPHSAHPDCPVVSRQCGSMFLSFTISPGLLRDNKVTLGWLLCFRVNLMPLCPFNPYHSGAWHGLYMHWIKLI